MNAKKHKEKKSGREPHKNDTCCLEQILEVTLYKKKQLHSYLPSIS